MVVLPSPLPPFRHMRWRVPREEGTTSFSFELLNLPFLIENRKALHYWYKGQIEGENRLLLAASPIDSVMDGLETSEEDYHLYLGNSADGSITWFCSVLQLAVRSPTLSLLDRKMQIVKAFPPREVQTSPERN
ncbi:hypothetical protein Tco_0592862 [Tanacetum coccineum]